MLTNDCSGSRSGARSISPASRSRVELVVGFVLAMLVSQCTRSKKLYTTIFLVPMMIVPIVVGYNFSMIYIDSGPLNQFLAPLLEPFGIDPRIRWLSAPGRRAAGPSSWPTSGNGRR